MEPASPTAPRNDDPDGHQERQAAPVPPAASPEPAAEERAPGATLTGSAPEEPTRLRRSEERRPRDMVMSLAVLLVPIALLIVFYRVVLSGDAPITVDPAPAIQQAQQAAAFTVVTPRGLSDDWHVSSATFKRTDDGATLRLGYVDPDDDPIQLVETSVATDTILPAELTKSAKPTGNYRAGNGVWRLYDARPGEKALVLADTTRTIVIVGATDVRNLQTLAGSLS